MNQKENALHHQVYVLIVSPPEILHSARNNWIARCKMSVEWYAKTTLSTHKQVDGFFLLGVACKFATHLVLIHLDGVWTTHGDSAF